MEFFGAQYRVGLDLGNKAVYAALVRGTGESLVCERVVKISRAELPADDVHGLALQLRARLESAGIPVRNVVLGLPAHAGILRYSTAPPAPPWRMNLLVEYEVHEMAERMGEALCAGWRVQPVGGKGGERPLLMVLGKEAEINTHLGALRAAGFQVASVVPSAEALLEAWHTFLDRPPGDGVEVLLELGAKGAHFIVTLDGDLLYARQAVFGGAQFNEVLAERVDGTPEDVERLKIASTGLDQDGSRLDFSELLRRPAGQLVNLLRGTLSWAEGQAKLGKLSLARITLTGGGAQLRGLDRYLKASLGVEVARAGLGGHMAPDAERTLRGGIEGFLPAMGLGALLPGGEDVLEVLPRAEKERRTFWKEKVFMYGAAVALALFLALQLVAGFVQSSARNARLAGLRAQLHALKGESDRLDEERRNQRLYENQTAALRREVGGHLFMGRLCGFLGNDIAPEIQVSEIKQWRGKDREQTMAVEVSGLADDTDRSAVQRIEHLEVALRRQPFVGEVRLMQGAPDAKRNAYSFTLRVSARDAAVQKGGAGG